MVIEIINIQRVVVGKAEDDPPVGPDRHGPKAYERALQRMQLKTWQVHVRNRASRIETRKDVTQLPCVFGEDPARIVLFVKAFQPLVPNRPDHSTP